MNPVQYKLYHADGFHSRRFLDTYFASEAGKIIVEEAVNLFLEKHSFFANIQGGTLIDVALGPLLYHLYSACEHFREIILLRFNDHCIMELHKYLHHHPGAFNWQNTISMVAKKEGRVLFPEKEKRLCATVTHVLKCYIDPENLTHPLQLPPADCLFIKIALDDISKDHDDYIRNFRQLTKMLKPGGQLLLFGLLKATFFIVGGEKCHLLEYEEDFLRKVLEGEEYVINHCETHPIKKESHLSDYKASIFIAAQKKP